MGLSLALTVAAFDETRRREGDHENFGQRRIGEREQSVVRRPTRIPSVVGKYFTLEIDERRAVARRIVSAPTCDSAVWRMRQQIRG
jgi:hypothetical protein